MKRHPTLHPLSEEHHHGLVLCLRLRKLAIDDPAAAETMLQEAWKSELQDHFRLEDDILLPEMALASTVNHPDIVRTCTDHVMLRLLIRRIARAPLNEKAPLLVAFADCLEEHIRFEERILFCTAESLLGEEGLSRLGFVSRFEGENSH